MTFVDDACSRTMMLLGPERFARLRQSFVVVVGLGGVGSYASEALARAGVGKLRLVDCDVVKPSNINRQLFATIPAVGKAKAEIARERLLAINPALCLDCRNAFFHHDTATELLTAEVNFVIDAIDAVGPKVELIRYCVKNNIPVISAMGAAGRMDPSQIRVTTLQETKSCRLARILRKKLRHQGVTDDIPVVSSLEQPAEGCSLAEVAEPETPGTYVRGRARHALPSISTIPGIFGLLAAHYAIEQIVGRGEPVPNK